MPLIRPRRDSLTLIRVSRRIPILPPEIILLIMKYLPPSDVITCRRACRTMYNLSKLICSKISDNRYIINNNIRSRNRSTAVSINGIKHGLIEVDTDGISFDISLYNGILHSRTIVYKTKTDIFTPMIIHITTEYLFNNDILYDSIVEYRYRDSGSIKGQKSCKYVIPVNNGKTTDDAYLINSDGYIEFIDATCYKAEIDTIRKLAAEL